MGKISIEQIKAARILLGWHQADLSARSGLSIVTIKRLESVGTGPLGGTDKTYGAIVAALERVGIEFLNHGEPGVRLRKAKRKR
jgi:transcriptional regulator with XRE-family HTH domain